MDITNIGFEEDMDDIDVIDNNHHKMLNWGYTYRIDSEKGCIRCSDCGEVCINIGA